ncbi:hypothetical protein MSPP1_003112 [Malassezia sp. CBS 17886]|nr:hypothetical protein MSPP1_003112 [Malassezia sp. CBS 17886]
MGDDRFLFCPPHSYHSEHEVEYTHARAPLTHRALLNDPLDPAALRQSALADQRRLHIRRLYDLLQLMLLRGDAPRAARALRQLFHAYEWRPEELWSVGVRVATMVSARDAPAATPLRVISSLRYRHNPQLHTYLGLLTLYFGSQSHRAGSSSGLSALPTSSLRAALHHFENAVKVAQRYARAQGKYFGIRAQRAEYRRQRIMREITAYRPKVWRSMRDDGWLFDEGRPEGGRGGDAASYSRKRRRPSADGDMSEATDADAVECGFPDAAFFGIESEFDTQASSDESDAAPVAVSPEGPSLPPSTAVSATQSPASSSDSESAVAHSAQPGAAADACVAIPACEWAVEVARAYVEMLAPLVSSEHIPRRARALP